MLTYQRLGKEKSSLKSRTYVIVVVVVVFTILRSLIITKEKVQRCALDLGDRMKASRRDNCDGLCIIPVLLSIIAVRECAEKKTYQTPFFQSSLVNTTAHMASSPLFDKPSALVFGLLLSLPLSPMTVPPIPRSSMPNSMACTARLSL